MAHSLAEDWIIEAAVKAAAVGDGWESSIESIDAVIEHVYRLHYSNGGTDITDTVLRNAAIMNNSESAGANAAVYLQGLRAELRHHA